MEVRPTKRMQELKDMVQARREHTMTISRHTGSGVQGLILDLDEMAEVLVRAKRATYAGNGAEVESQRPPFKELEYKEGNWTYRDSYYGHYAAPGDEVLRYNDDPVWFMSYKGGMIEKYQSSDHASLAADTFAFLKEALMEMDVRAPYRGPSSFKRGRFLYVSSVTGTIRDFDGREGIFISPMGLVFTQNFMGQVPIPK